MVMSDTVTIPGEGPVPTPSGPSSDRPGPLKPRFVVPPAVKLIPIRSVSVGEWSPKAIDLVITIAAPPVTEDETP